MKFSVVIPCYNAEQWINQALQSIAEQTIPASEVIVVDDGSTDRSIECLRRSPVPTKILRTPNLGPGGARNAGIAAATGDWVAFLDADDWWKPNHLERIQDLVGNSDDVLYLAAAEHYSISADRVVSMSDTGPFSEPTGQLDHATYFQLYRKHGILELSSLAARRSHLQAVGGFDEKASGAEDLELVLQVIHGQTWAYDPVPSSLYRCSNPASYSRTAHANEQRLTAKFRVFLKHRDHYQISQSIFMELGKTMMSKAIMSGDWRMQQRVKELVYYYLSTPQKAVFSIAGQLPTFYSLLNQLRNQLKGEQYRPRKVLNPVSA